MPTKARIESAPTLRTAVLVVATPGDHVPYPVSRWDDETAAMHRARSAAADGLTALGFSDQSFHQVELSLPVLVPTTSAIAYLASLDGAVNCGHDRDPGAVRTIRLGTMDNEAHYAHETCEENGCRPGACEGRAHIDCEACVRDPLIEPYLKQCEWCRRDGVAGEAIAAIAVDGVVVLTSQCAGCAAHSRGGRFPTRT